MILRRKASAKKARNGPSTEVIEYTSFVKIAIDSKKAEVNSKFSSYQMLTMDNDFVVKLRANEARKKSCPSRTTIAVKLLSDGTLMCPLQFSYVFAIFICVCNFNI